ncbi:RodZ domain-containing protein [Oceanimonas doudoroffii]|uniref:Helix-turn-helix domain-containing protein n=1 Tax=Oceanimonas doudoroffii TaxID=84158 RepID=A0A233REH1_9GAMM|nr:RodZ domain-containing protein [Oceanimonas doudoroffii]OXY81795.1 helix-turn-helix domain-containing protein [Oceanimonas doudoroffii]
MTTNEEQQQAGEEQQAPTSGPGALLRQAREGRGWSQNEVARRLNLRVAVIESLDSDQYKAGVALTFLRGYVKAYARLVGVSEQQALAAFDGMAGMEQRRQDATVSMQSFSKKTRQQASDKWLKRISWLVLLGLGTSLVFWWWQNSGAGFVERGEPVPQQQIAEPVDAPEPAPLLTSPALNDAADEAVTIPAGDADLTGAPVLPAETPAAPAVVEDVTEVAPEPTPEPAPAAEPKADPQLLVLSFSDDCWIKVTDAEGRVLSEGVKKSSDRLELKGEPPFRLVLGAPQAASVEYLNQAVDLSSFRAGRVARLTVPQS